MGSLSQGGMGSVTQALRRRCEELGVTFELGKKVVGLVRDGDRAAGVVTEDGDEVRASVAVVFGCDPFTLKDIAGVESLGEEVAARMTKWEMKASDSSTHFTGWTVHCWHFMVPATGRGNQGRKLRCGKFVHQITGNPPCRAVMHRVMHCNCSLGRKRRSYCRQRV